MNYSFFKKEKFGLREQTTFIGSKCEIYIPAYYFNKNDPRSFAVDMGDRIESMGLFWFKVDNSSWYELQLPLKIQFQFRDKRKERLSLSKGIPEIDYIVYTLGKNDAFIYDNNHKKDLDDFKVDVIQKLVTGGKLPAYIPYTDCLDVFINAMRACDLFGLGVSSVSIEFLLSELYRNRRNMHDPFRLAFNGNNNFDYKMVRITKIPELNSTFTGIMGEDLNSQLISAVLKNREGVEEKETPIEKLLKY